MTALSVEGLEKRFGASKALNNVSLDIADGEFVSLLGPSGCGKTTTLRCVAGFERPDAGRIRFGGVDMTDAAPERRDIGMVFQSYALFPHMTVAENLAFGLEARRVPAEARRRRCATALTTVRLEDFGDRFPRQLSGGQQQRVALARALVIEPSILLLDEPLANLDAALRDEMRLFIRALQQRAGVTAVYVTHDQGEAMTMSDRIVVMRAGEVAQIGAPREIYERPASLEVARFIGRVNTLAGTLRGRDEAGFYRVETPHGGLAVAGPDGLKPGGDAVVLVRPECLRLGPGHNQLSAALTLSAYQGSSRQLAARLSDGETLIVDAPGRGDLADSGALHFAPAEAWVLPA